MEFKTWKNPSDHKHVQIYLNTTLDAFESGYFIKSIPESIFMIPNPNSCQYHYLNIQLVV